MKPKQAKMPEQRGKIMFEGQQATKFWIRVFKLENEIEAVRELMTKKRERAWASVPIVSEFMVDDKLLFLFLVLANVDVLGVKDGSGIIYWASPEHKAEARQIRDRHASDLLTHMETERTFDEVLAIEPKKED